MYRLRLVVRHSGNNALSHQKPVHTHIHTLISVRHTHASARLQRNPEKSLGQSSLTCFTPCLVSSPPPPPGLRTGIHRHARFNVRSMANKRRLGVPRCWKTNAASNGIAAGIVHYTTVQLLSHTIHLLLFFKPFLPRIRNFNQKSTKHPAQLNTTCRISRKTWVLFAILVVFEIG